MIALTNNKTLNYFSQRMPK